VNPDKEATVTSLQKDHVKANFSPAYFMSISLQVLKVTPVEVLFNTLTQTEAGIV